MYDVLFTYYVDKRNRAEKSFELMITERRTGWTNHPLILFIMKTQSLVNQQTCIRQQRNKARQEQSDVNETHEATTILMSSTSHC